MSTIISIIIFINMFEAIAAKSTHFTQECGPMPNVIAALGI